MTEKLGIYRCKICGNIIQVIKNGIGELVCCGENMELMQPNKQENVVQEYHIPVYKADDNGTITIQVGKELHPMTQEHHIEFIERISEDKTKITLQYLDVKQEPKIEVPDCDDNETALELCNLHGLWEGKNAK